MVKMMNIQIAQSMLGAMDGKATSGKGNISAESELSPKGVNLPQVKDKNNLPDHINTSTVAKDVYEISYPPFFPIGNTQGIYSLMIQATTDRSSSDAVKTEKADDTAGSEAVAARQEVAGDEDKTIKNDVPETEKKTFPGSVLDLIA
jgi:hypothetical protein